MSMTEPAYPTSGHDYESDAAELERLEAAANRGPAGAAAVSGIAVGLLMLAWLFIYFFVFLPRGTVG
jgi:asparagine N-glycosylation enzyme membrane subunit Stt3